MGLIQGHSSSQGQAAPKPFTYLAPMRERVQKLGRGVGGAGQQVPQLSAHPHPVLPGPSAALDSYHLQLHALLGLAHSPLQCP
jgi:hypothetical protein